MLNFSVKSKPGIKLIANEWNVSGSFCQNCGNRKYSDENSIVICIKSRKEKKDKGIVAYRGKY